MKVNYKTWTWFLLFSLTLWGCATPTHPADISVPFTRSAVKDAYGKIAFYSDRAGMDATYVINVNNAAPETLLIPGGEDPAWSPDGKEIAFTMRNRDDKGIVWSEIYVANADGSGQTRLTTPASINHGNPAWSPNGSKIAFVSGHSSDGAIYVMDADGSNQAKLIDNGYLPVWSPDGRKIVFVTSRDYPNGGSEVYLMDADGSNQIRLTSDGSSSSPAWSPDGSKIAFDSWRDGLAGIYVMNADGSNQIKLIAGGSEPAWSPDGRKIVFCSFLQRTSQDFGSVQISVMDIDGSNPIRLTDVGMFNRSPSWAP